MASSTADGSVVIDVNMNVNQAEKQLEKLKQNIEKTERTITDLTSKRNAAREKGALGAELLDAEKVKLEEIKHRLMEVKAIARDKNAAPEDRDRAAGELPRVQQDLAEQQMRVRMLQTEYNRTEAAAERYESRLEEASQNLAQQKTDAGLLTQQIDAARDAQAGMAGVLARASAYMDRFLRRVKGLVSRVFVFTIITSALRGIRTWIGKAVKSNDEAAAAIARLKGALLTLVQPLIEVIIPAFTSLVNVLANVAAAIASIFSTIFGKTAQQSKEAAEGLYNEANALDETGAAAKKAGKFMASFDEINQLSGSSDAGGGGGKASDAIAPDFSVMDGLSERLEDIARYVFLIGAGFALWKIGNALPGLLGTIATKLGLIMIAIGGLLLLWGGLKDAWENGVDWLNLIEMVGGLAIAAGALYAVLGPVAAGILLIVGGLALLVTGFRDAMENGWSLQNALLSIAGILGTGLGISLLIGSWFPLLMAGIASVLLALTVATGHGEELLSGLRLIMEGFVDFFTGIFARDLAQIIGGVEKIFDGLGQAVGAVFDGVRDSILSFLNWLDEKTGGKFHNIIETAKGFVTSVVDFTKNKTLNTITTIKDILNGLITFLAGPFTQDWDLAWEGVKSIFKAIWNGIITCLEMAANLIADGINYVISLINNLLKSSLVQKGLSMVGIHDAWIEPIKHVELPRLAQGAVIPANREFLAVLGDQRSGTNVETPLSTIEQAVENVFRRRGGGMGGDSQTIILECDGIQFAKLVYKLNQSEKRRRGVSLSEV